MEVPRLGVESELQLPAYTTAIATQDPSHLCDLHHSSQQRRILNPLSKTRDWTCILMDTSQVHYRWATTETPNFMKFKPKDFKWRYSVWTYTTATATWDPSHICNIHCSSQQCQILNPLSKTRDWTRILMDTSWVLNTLSHDRNSETLFLNREIKGQKCFSDTCWLKSEEASL